MQIEADNGSGEQPIGDADKLQAQEATGMSDEERLVLAGCILALIVLEPIFGYRSAMTFAASVSVGTLLRPVFGRSEGKKRSTSLLGLD